ncbi:EAL and HDOD domain-containing protein [Seleniivibrio woodruffii]|uniref:EAL and HDOD domain-containing protein n=1 Tax=Seleniivibrio woodruffii TaxID=1078050 RepID=UPI0039E6174D
MIFDNFLVGRQPILDRNEEVFGYEFLFRKAGDVENKAEIFDSVVATSRVLVNIFQNFGIKSLTNGKYAFINIDEEIIEQDVLDVLPKDKVVFEIVETTNVKKEVVEKVAAYHRDGYMFALDDFVLSSEYFAMFMPLFPYVEYLKVDMKENCLVKMERVEKIFSGRHMMLLAEKVETRGDFDFSRDCGFELFQGFFFEKPTVMNKRNVEPGKAVILRLLSHLSQNAELDKLGAEFRIQPELSLKLLKLINACQYCLRTEINSIRHALTLIGRENMRKWLTIMLYASTGGKIFKSTLLETAMLRAHTLELLSIKVFGENYTGRADAFFIGLLSYVDVVLGVSKEDLMESINVKPLIREAVLERKGELGNLLAILEDVDDANSEIKRNKLAALRLTEEDISDVKFRGLDWLAEQQSVYNSI